MTDLNTGIAKDDGKGKKLCGIIVNMKIHPIEFIGLTSWRLEIGHKFLVGVQFQNIKYLQYSRFLRNQQLVRLWQLLHVTVGQ